MLFLGIDFGWQGKPSGLASAEWANEGLELRTMLRRTGLAEVLTWVDEQAGSGPAMIGIDAPIVIPNQTGMRMVDRLMHREFGRYHAGCYPANLGLPSAERTLALSRALEQRGFRHAADIASRVSGRYQIEVHPHAACVQLFDLPRILKYKKGRVAERRAELLRYRRLLLTKLPLFRSLNLPDLPDSGAALKEVEDQMDAVLCAYIAAVWWLWGTQRATVYGSEADGYIVVPHRVSGVASP